MEEEVGYDSLAAQRFHRLGGFVFSRRAPVENPRVLQCNRDWLRAVNAAQNDDITEG